MITDKINENLENNSLISFVNSEIEYNRDLINKSPELDKKEEVQISKSKKINNNKINLLIKYLMKIFKK